MHLQHLQSSLTLARTWRISRQQQHISVVAGKDGSPDGQGIPDWSSLGGLQPVIRQLKEMVILPLLYPGLYQQMDITAPQ